MLEIIGIAIIMLSPMLAGGITFWLSIKTTEEKE